MNDTWTITLSVLGTLTVVGGLVYFGTRPNVVKTAGRVKLRAKAEAAYVRGIAGQLREHRQITGRLRESIEREEPQRQAEKQVKRSLKRGQSVAQKRQELLAQLAALDAVRG